ncbi:MAG: hypothetical protein HOP19_18470 [Acidobacteria bacterium]|nr:hypothetical protein [Acidobacteriota bacterium]
MSNSKQKQLESVPPVLACLNGSDYQMERIATGERWRGHVVLSRPREFVFYFNQAKTFRRLPQADFRLFPIE